MKKFFLFWLLLLVVLAGLYYLALRGQVSSPADWLGALGGGAALTLVTGAFHNAWSARKGRVLLDRTLTGAPYEDGKQTAAVGPILALGSPVYAPFSGEPCVLCSWRITHEVPIDEHEPEEGKKHIEDFSGFIMAPCVVQDPAGNVRLLDLPTIAGFPAEVRRGKGDFQRAREYLQSASFEKASLVKLISEELAADEAGCFRKDWREAGDDFRLDPKDHTLTEYVVRDDETVCAIGIYSAQRQGLVSGKIRESARIKLIQGDSAAARKNLAKTFWKYSVGGGLFLIFTHAMLFHYADRNKVQAPVESKEARDYALFQAVGKGDLAAVTAALDAGLDPNARDEGNYTPLMVVDDPRVARRLLLAGADVNVRGLDGHTPLIEAARSCKLEVVRLLLQAGAAVQARDPASNRTALEWTEDCYPQGDERHEEVVKALREAGAREKSR